MDIENEKAIEAVVKAKEHAAKLAQEAAAAADHATNMAHEHGVADDYVASGNHTIPAEKLDEVTYALEYALEKIKAVTPNIALSAADRQRLNGSGVRRLGFIEKVHDTAQMRPEFDPAFFSLAALQQWSLEIEYLRNIRSLALAVDRIANDALLVAGDEAFRLALMYYNSVRDAARRRVPGAEELFRILELFFRRGRQADSEPTETETLRDAKALLHGKKDGKIIIEGHAKHTTAAEHTVVDDTHKPQNDNFKEVIHGTICTECHANNPENAKFCVNCGKEIVKV